MLVDSIEIKAFEKIVFHKVVFKAPFRHSSIIQENSACFFYIVEGKYHSFSQTEDMKLNAKEGIVKKCGNYILEYFETPESDMYEAIAIYFYPDILKEIYKDEIPKFLKNQTSKNYTHKVASNELVDRYIQSLLFYFENPQLVDDDLVTLKLKELILLLLKTEKGLSILELVSDFFNPQVSSFKEIIEKNLYKSLNIEELAYLAGLSLSSFQREFKKIYQDSPASYIRNKKLAKASDLLQNTSLRINDIAFDCGFNDLANFSTAFRKRYGVSPKNFRDDKN